MVTKVNGKRRMYVGFTDLNDACPKDCFPLPKIDTLIHAIVCHEMLSFMNGFSGYNQIWMDKMVFIRYHTLLTLVYYLVMAFDLKNARSTYQRLTIKMFKYLIGKTMESNICKIKKSPSFYC